MLAGISVLPVAAAAVAAAAALIDWLAVSRAQRRVEYVAKPAATLALLCAAVLLTPADGGQRAWFVAGLALSLAGDVFLMLPRDLFVAGLASFLAAHLAYIAGFAAGGFGGTTWLEAAALAVLAVAIAGVGRSVLRGVRTSGNAALFVPVVGYIAVIGAMAACAALSGDAVATAGAAVFMLSDSLIAWNRFVRPLPGAPVAIMVTYHAAQALLVLSLL